jgi:hypothetical protein
MTDGRCACELRGGGAAVPPPFFCYRRSELDFRRCDVVLEGLVSGHDFAMAKPFVGRVENGTFKFRSVITGRNSFLPIISGRIIEAEGGAVVNGTMRLHLLVAAFMTFWMAITIIGAVLALNKFVTGSETAGDVFSAWFFPLFGGTLTAIGYYPERRKAMRLLGDALQPEPHSNSR